MSESKYEPHFDASLQGVVIGEGNTVNIFPNDNQHRYSENTLPHSIWTVPYPSNPFFTGREPYLDQLHNNLLNQQATALTQPQAINGLGGIGKTQIAVEYAHRHRDDYPYVLWVNAASNETLFTGFLTLAKLLGMPLSNETDQESIIIFVRNWLDTHTNWLLILDNADDLELARSYLPTKRTGHIILTTREQIVSPFVNLEVQKMNETESTLLLLRRANRLDTATDTEKAIAEAMDGLPLALDQAGAYIEETGCTLTKFLERYQQHHLKYLQQRGRNTSSHPEPVATTWLLNFEQVEQHNPLAADLFRCCAFLAPDAIPEECFTKGARELSPLLQSLEQDASLLDEAIGELRRFSLIRNNRDEATFSIHRLVQAILKASMDETTQREWAERTIRMVNLVFPGKIDVATWKQCQRYITHAQMCATWIEAFHLAFPEAAALLNKAGYYLDDLALYSDAEPLYQRALQIWEQVVGPQHPDTANSLNNLAGLYYNQGQYEQAEPLYQRALQISEQVLGPQHPATASSLNNLAGLYDTQGQYERAEPLYQRALHIREQVLGPQHPNTATSLNNLALLYDNQGKYEQAEPLYQRALQIWEQVLGPQHPNTATSLNNLAGLYDTQGQYERAEPLYQRALHIREQVVGPQHPDTAQSLNNLAELYRSQGKYEQAEPLYQRALQIWEQVLGPQHPATASSLNNLAGLYHTQGQYEQAEPLYQRALQIWEQVVGPQHPDTANSLNNLAGLYHTQGQYERAEPLYQRALHIREQVVGPQHPDTATSLNNLAELYRSQGKYEQAEPLYQRALRIYEQVLGPEHPFTATSLNDLAELYRSQGKYEQAEPLYQRALRIYEQVLGPEHPNTANSLNNLAYLYYNQGQYEQAEPLYQRAVAIMEKMLGSNHPNTITVRKNYTVFLEDKKQRHVGKPES